MVLYLELGERNPEETSPEITKSCTSGPKIGHVNVSAQTKFKKTMQMLKAVLVMF